MRRRRRTWRLLQKLPLAGLLSHLEIEPILGLGDNGLVGSFGGHGWRNGRRIRVSAIEGRYVVLRIGRQWRNINGRHATGRKNGVGPLVEKRRLS